MKRVKNRIYPFGDSHWQVFFEKQNVDAIPWTFFRPHPDLEIVDTTSNELAGATMYSLLKDKSTHMARQRILRFINSNQVQHLGLIFGEVDCRYHMYRFAKDGRTLASVADELAERYKLFITRDVAPKVAEKIFVYFGYRYTEHAYNALDRNEEVFQSILELTRALREVLVGNEKIVPIIYGSELEEPGTIFLKKKYWTKPSQNEKEVHLHPLNTFTDFLYPKIKDALNLAP